MSIETMAVVLHHSRAKGTAKLVLVGIANHDGDGGAYPAVPTLARYANVDTRNAQRAVDKLVEAGELRVQLQAGGDVDTPDHERTNRYHVLVECPEGCARDRNHKPRKGWKREQDGTYVRRDGAVDNGVASVSPGGASATTPDDDSATTPGGASATQTTHTTINNSGSTYVEGPREDTTPPCTECSAPNLSTCQLRQRKLAQADRHTYAPRPLP